MEGHGDGGLRLDHVAERPPRLFQTTLLQSLQAAAEALVHVEDGGRIDHAAALSPDWVQGSRDPYAIRRPRAKAAI